MKYNLLLKVQGEPKKLHKVQITIFMQLFQTKLNRFHQNVPRVPENKD